MEDLTQTIHEANSWNPFAMLADNNLIILILIVVGLIFLLKFIGSGKRAFR
ncbi:MAG: hypothetical protein ACXACY_30415 [Candidatus Hodarchaeales archaeon]|jgi:hypothetical protein